MLTLPQIMAQQKAAGIKAPPEGIRDDSSAEGGLAKAGVPAARDHPKATAPGVGPSAELSTGNRGFIRIFPPQFASINQVTEEFRKEFWTGSSPWCRVEGQPDHPDFEDNLKRIENA